MSPGAWAFVLLLGLAFATAGFTGYLIFGPLTYRHLQDRKRTQGLGNSFVAPAFLSWLLLRRGWREHADPNLSGLATPAWVLGWCLLVGGVLTVVAMPFKP